MYNFNEELCKKLSNGEIAVHYNNGDLEMLRALLRECFPKDKSPTGGSSRYYVNLNGYWHPQDETTKPTVPLSDFIVKESEKEFEWTDELVVEFTTWSLSSSPAMQGRYADIEQFKASKQRKCLFTTEDGNEVFEGDEYWTVDIDDNYEISLIKATGKWENEIEGFKDFSTEAAAKEYVRLNKPLYSLNLISTAMKAYNFSEFQIEKIITELEKLKQ